MPTSVWGWPWDWEIRRRRVDQPNGTPTRSLSASTARVASRTSARVSTPTISPWRLRTTPSMNTVSTFDGCAASTTWPSRRPTLAELADPLESEDRRGLGRGLAQHLLRLVDLAVVGPGPLDAHRDAHGVEHVRVVARRHGVQ